VSWLISAALMRDYENSRSSQGLVEAFSAATCSDGARSALSSGTPTPQAFLSPDKMTDFSRPSRFGMTFAPLTDGLGEELLTWFLAGFPARTFQAPDGARESKASDPPCGSKWKGSLAKFCPDTFGWKTAQCSLLGDSDEYLEDFPRWGTTVAGELYLLPMPARLTSGNGSGSSRTRVWPTPTAHNAKEGGHPSEHGRNTATLTAQAAGGVPTQPTTLNPEWVEWLQGWPRGWTDLRPLGTARSQQQWPLHGVA